MLVPFVAPPPANGCYCEFSRVMVGANIDKASVACEVIYAVGIRAHAAICFMALILYRVMRTRLRQSDSQLSPERALSKLRRIQHQRVTINSQPIPGMSSITQEHSSILAALTIKKTYS